MSGTGALVVRIILSIILIPSIIIFITLFSVIKNIDEDNFTDSIGKTAIEVLENSIVDEINQTAVNYSELHSEAILECESKQKIVVQEIDLGISCDEIRSSGPDGLRDLLKEEIGEKIGQELEVELKDKAGINSIGDLFGIVKVVLITLGIISFILIAPIIILSVPKYKFANNLGIVGLLSGLPFLFINMLPIPKDFPALNSIVNPIINSLFKGFLIVFFAGFLLLFIGIFWGIDFNKQGNRD